MERLMVRTAFLAALVSVMSLSACGGGGASSQGAPAAVLATGSSATPAATSTPTSAARVPTVAGCQVFPADNPWNADISSAPLDPNSSTYLAAMNAAATNLHPDFGSDPTYGIRSRFYRQISHCS